MPVTWNNGDTTTITVPQVLADLSGNLSSGQLPAAGVPVTSISATGTPSSSTYLCGNGTWATPTGSGGSMTWPATPGISVYAGSNAWGASLTAPASAIVGVNDSQTLTNKTLTSPTLTAPALGTPASGTLTNCTFPTLNQNTSGSAATATTASACSGNSATVTGLSVTASKTLTAQNSITLAGTDSTTMTFPSTTATIARTDAANTFTGHQTIEGVTSTGATGTGNLVFSATPTFTGTVGAAAITATGTVQGATLTSTGAVNAGTSKFVVNSSGVCTAYNNVTLTGAGIPTEVGIATATTATAAVAATNLLAAPVAATVYVITAYLKITVATSTPVAGPVTITYADKDGVAQSVVMAMQNAAGAIATTTGSTTTTPISGSLAIYANSGTAIKYAIGFSGSGTYEYVFKCESL